MYLLANVSEKVSERKLRNRSANWSDGNGSYNIIRSFVPNALSNGIEGVVVHKREGYTSKLMSGYLSMKLVTIRRHCLIYTLHYSLIN